MSKDEHYYYGTAKDGAPLVGTVQPRKVFYERPTNWWAWWITGLAFMALGLALRPFMP